MRVLGALLCALFVGLVVLGVAAAPGASTAGAQGGSQALRGILSPAQSPMEHWPTAAGLVQTGAKGVASACEICIYVMENKAINQPYLCRGLKDPASQKMVSRSEAEGQCTGGRCWGMAGVNTDAVGAAVDRSAGPQRARALVPASTWFCLLAAPAPPCPC